MTGWRKGARVVRRGVVATAVAALVVAAGSRVNVADERAWAGPEVEGVLRRRVADAGIDVRTLGDAARTLGAAAGVRIELDPSGDARRDRLDGLRRRDGGEGDELRLRDATLGRALAEVVRRFDGHDDGGRESDLLTFVVEGDGVRIGREADLEAREPAVVRVYDVTDLIDEIGPDDPERVSAFDVFMRFVQETMLPTLWRNTGAGRGDIYWWGQRMVVVGPASLHRDLGRLLFLLRHPAPPVAMRPAGATDAAAAGVAR